jgi:peptidoglycan/LPS O-acetylase OafA/YrhL
MDGIAFGCLAALLAARLRLGRGALRSMMALGIALASSIVVFRGLASSLGLHQVGLDVSILELGVAMMLIAMSQGIGHEVLTGGTGWLRSVGRSSYEIYLTHMLVILGLMPRIVAAKPETPAIIAWYVVLLISSVALGYLVHRVYSEPLNRALRSLYASAFAPPLVAPIEPPKDPRSQSNLGPSPPG